MSGQGSSSTSHGGDTDTGGDAAATANNTAASVIRWAPHGRALTACLVAVNVAIVALIYLYFWRFFSRKRSAGDEEEEEDASSSASTPAPEPLRNQDQQQRDHDRLVESLPTFVVRAGAGEKGPAAAGECAVCIAELRDGDEARALPLCGHRFHAACVDAWLRRHATCPICRGRVSAVETGAGPKGGGGGVTNTTASAVDLQVLGVCVGVGSQEIGTSDT